MVILCYGYISRIAIKAPLRTPKALHSRTCEVKFSESLLICSSSAARLMEMYASCPFMSVVPSFSKKSMAVCLISLSKSFDLYISSVILLRTSGEEVSCDKNVKSE